jgi:hypothetical protein
VLMCGNVLDEDHFRRLDGLGKRNQYVVVVEAELKGEVFAFVECALGALELHVPEGEVVGGQGYFHVCVGFLDRFELLLEPFGHSLRHFIHDRQYYKNYYMLTI